MLLAIHRLFGFFLRMGFIVLLENFSLIWTRHHNRWRVQILTYARHSWPLSSDGFLACYIYCDTGHPFIMVISKDPWHTPIAELLAVGLSIPVFTTKVCRGWYSNIQPSACGATATVNTSLYIFISFYTLITIVVLRTLT